MLLPNVVSMAVVALGLLVAPSFAFAADDHEGEHGRPEHGELAEEYVEGASRLDGRIRAPCCWNQTIDIHGSPVANELRQEIRTRLKAGEPPDAIEASIVARYGERVLAVPPGSPLKKVAIGLSVLMGAAGVGAIFLVGRWRKRSKAQQAEPSASKEPQDPELDRRLDEELADLER